VRNILELILCHSLATTCFWCVSRFIPDVLDYEREFLFHTASKVYHAPGKLFLWSQNDAWETDSVYLDYYIFQSMSAKRTITKITKITIKCLWFKKNSPQCEALMITTNSHDPSTCNEVHLNQNRLLLVSIQPYTPQITDTITPWDHLSSSDCWRS